MNNIQLLKCSVHERAMPKGYKARDVKEYNSKPRIYVHPAGESIMENFANRRSRPSKLYRQLAVAPALKALGLPADTKVTWSQFAGCTMCPCSPGFIVQAYGTPKANVHCTVGDPAEQAVRVASQIEEDRERIVMHFAD